MRLSARIKLDGTRHDKIWNTEVKPVQQDEVAVWVWRILKRKKQTLAWYKTLANFKAENKHGRQLNWANMSCIDRNAQSMHGRLIAQ